MHRSNSQAGPMTHLSGPNQPRGGEIAVQRAGIGKRLLGVGILLSILGGAALAPNPAWSQSFAWDNPGGGSWSGASNWDPFGVPGAGDDVFISSLLPDNPFGIGLDATTSPYRVNSVNVTSPQANLRLDTSVTNPRGAVELDVSDTFAMTAGTLTLRGISGDSAYLHADNGLFFSGTAQVITAQGVRLGGDISNSGNMNFSGGVWLDGSGATGVFNNSGTVTMGASGVLERISHATLNSGTFIIDYIFPGGQADVNGFTNLAGGTLRIASARLELTHEDLVNGGVVEMTKPGSTLGTLPGFTGKLVNEAGGLIDLQAGDGGVRNIFNTLENAGLVEVGADLLLGRFDAEHVNSGRITLVNGSTVEIRGGVSFTNTTTGTIDGNGSLDVRSIDFIDQGTLSPGNSFGRIDILGDYLQEVDGILELEIGAGGQDELLISGGTGTFNGTLRLIFLDAYAPQLGDTFDLVSGDIVASFNQVDLLGLEAGFQYELTAGPGGLQLEALNDAVASAVPLPGAAWLLASALLGLASGDWRRLAG